MADTHASLPRTARLLVTGGAGFIGANFVRRHLERYPDHTLVVLDRLTYAGNLASLAGLDERYPGYRFVRGDVASPDDVAAAFDAAQGPLDALVHFAAESHVDRSIDDASPFIHTNVLGTQVLLEAARRRGVGRFLHVSTDEVYGSLGPDDPPFTEETPIAPNSPYAASKAGSDCLVRAYVHTHKLPAVITRCSNNYGPYQFPEKFIPLFITNALENRPLPLYGDGKNVRDWVHVHDHCDALERVLAGGRTGEVYNIGGNCERANIDIARAVCRATARPESLIQLVADRPGHDRRYAMSTARIERELGFRPGRPIEDHLEALVAWYEAERGWWTAIKSGAYRDYYAKMYGARLGV
jgi:dTDP-glucose 4,6-dehydratase